MKFKDVLDSLAKERQLPIKPDVLAHLIKTNTDIEQIVYIGVDVDAAILKGAFTRVRLSYNNTGPIPPPYSIPDNNLVVKIYYNRNLSEEWQRLVVNKELLHILDPEIVRCSTPEQFSGMIDGLRLPRELMMANPAGDEDRVRATLDYISDFRAVVAMVPEHFREILLRKFREEKINEEHVASLAGLPTIYAPFIVSDQWDTIKQIWLGMC